MKFLLKEKPDKEGLVRLYDEDFHYLVHVRRVKPGSVFTALLPEDNSTEKIPREVKVTVCSIDNKTLTGAISGTQGLTREKFPPEETMPDIILFQALPKGSKMDLIVRQAAELGINEVVPFISERSVPKQNPIKSSPKNSSDSKINRWRRIIKEARQQSGSLTDTTILTILNASELFAYWKKLQENQPGTLGLVFTPFSASEDNGVEKGGFHRYLYKKPSLLVLAVGPEGGLSEAELKSFIKAGFKTLSLGNTVLRTETAALCGAAAAKIILMERTLWKTTQQLNE